jgi:hypothetical protein
MKLHLVVLLAVALGCVGVWCQAATNDVASQASASIVSNGSVTPTTAVVLPRVVKSGGADDPLLAADRASIAKLFRASRSNDGCPNNSNTCGTACCSSDQQCCFNAQTGGHYCASKCSN